MSTSDRVKRIKVEILSIGEQLKSVPDFMIVERHNLETRKLSLISEIDKIESGPKEGQMGSSTVCFYGEPVIGSSGIRADFCGRALEKYQHLVSNLASKVYYKHLKEDLPQSRQKQVGIMILLLLMLSGAHLDLFSRNLVQGLELLIHC